MKAHDLAAQLLKCENLEVKASIDISKDEDGRRLFTEACHGINSYNGYRGEIIILFEAEPIDNKGLKI